MINNIRQTKDEVTGNILVHFNVIRTPDKFKISKYAAVEQIKKSGFEVGDLVAGQTVCNKTTYPINYVFTFKPIVSEEEKTLDKPEEKVILKKTRSRKPKKTTGG